MPANLRGATDDGLPIVGQMLTCDRGDWSNGPDLTVQWLGDGGEIIGATERTYQLQESDRRHRIGCRVSAVNDIGPAASEAVADPLLAVQDAPRIQRRPVATSKAVGARATDVELTCSDPGTWDEDYGAYEYRWQREGVEIAGATGRTYTATVDDLGRDLACVVFSTNPVGRSDGAASDGVLVPLPAGSAFGDGKIFKAGGFNQVDPTNLLALGKDYLQVIANLSTSRRSAAVIATRKDCAAGPYAKEPKPDFDGLLGKRLSARQTCGVLLADGLGFNVTQDHDGAASYWLGVGTFQCHLPGEFPPLGKGVCPKLRIDVPPLDPRNAAQHDHTRRAGRPGRPRSPSRSCGTSTPTGARTRRATRRRRSCGRSTRVASTGCAP